MIKLRIFKNPIVLSTTIAILASTLYALASIYLLDFPINSPLFWGGGVVIFVLSSLFSIVNLMKRAKSKNARQIETEEEALTESLEYQLTQSSKKSVYLLLGNKHSGKESLLFSSNAIKPIDKKNTVKTDFYIWYESDAAVYIKPNHRLIFQEVSNTDESLWLAFVQKLIDCNPRRPLAGCILCYDLEYALTHEDEQVDYTLEILKNRVAYITELTSCSLPLYLFITKLDKLHGFKEYISVSPIQSQIEHLSISLREAKGNITDFFERCYADVTSKLESNILECSLIERDWSDKQAIISFPKQFELCQSTVLKVLHSFNDINTGKYFIDIRGIYFTSSLQGGRKYNLVAKSCSNYFNLPVIASEHSQLSETPYFTRFVIDAHVLPEVGFAGENKRYLKRLIKQSQLTIVCCTLLACGYCYHLSTILNNNLDVINSLINLSEDKQSTHNSNNINDKFAFAVNAVEPYFQTWSNANQKLAKQVVPLGVSRLDQTTNLSHARLIATIEKKLLPLIEQSLSFELSKSQYRYSDSLELLKTYLMLSEVDKRDVEFMTRTMSKIFSVSVRNQDSVIKAIKYLDIYLKSNNQPIKISWDLVRTTRRFLLSKPKVDVVYAQVISQAKNNDLGDLDMSRAIGFEFNNVFYDRFSRNTLAISKLFTATGYSTFYRPRAELLSKQASVDNWVLGLSNTVVPTETELKSFISDVRKKYIDDYINSWRNALSELKLRRFNNLVELTNTIDLMSGPTSPLTTVLNILHSNTKLSPNADYLAELQKKNELINSAIEVVKEKAEKEIEPDYVQMSRVEQTFSVINQLQEAETKGTNSPWDQIIAALSDVRSYLKDITDAPNIHSAALTAAKSRMRGADVDPLIRLKQIAQKTPEPVKSWLLDIVNQTWAQLLTEATKGIQDEWTSEVSSEFRAIGLNRYPFSRNASKEISILEFEKFFAKGGTLDSFINEHLASFYDTNLWVAKRVDGEILPLSQALLIQLKNYNIIRNTLIDHSSNRFSIPFNAKVIDLDSSAIRANLNIAGQSINYYHGPTKVREMTWPPTSNDFIVSLTIQDISADGKQHTLTKEGQWALYRVLDQANLLSTQDGGFIAEIKVAGRNLKVKIKPSSPNNPFTLTELFNFTIPESIN